MSALLHEVLAEIAAAPWRFVAEVVQSCLVIALVWWFGRGPLRRRLASRQARVHEELEGATQAEAESARLLAGAGTLVPAARADAPAIVAKAREAAGAFRADAMRRADEEVQAIVASATRTVAEEGQRAEQERAARLVSDAARLVQRYLDEVLDEPARRALTHQAIEGLLAELAPTEPAGR